MRLRTAMRPVGHQDTLSVVGHLDELRTRLIVALATVIVAFGFCFWQNHLLLHLMNNPLARQTQAQVRAGQGPLGATYRVQQGARDVAVQVQTVAGALRQETHDPATLAHVGRRLSADVATLSAAPQGDRPVTLGIGEPFTTTLTVTLIFALILSLPILLHQAYAFLMPAVPPERRRGMAPLGAAVPVLFVAGVAFGYFVVLPAALHFFQNFNSSQFNVLVQASQYYKFSATTLLAMAATGAGVITPRQLRHNRRYAVGVCALVAAILPGDAITMLLETLPLYGLFELSLLIASVVDRRARRREARALAAAG
jgi:sec-independent protein translocase protein TatC